MAKMLLNFVVFVGLCNVCSALSQLRVDNGIYSKLTINIEEQKMPANCPKFLDDLEVGYLNFYFILIHSADPQSSIRLCPLFKI